MAKDGKENITTHKPARPKKKKCVAAQQRAPEESPEGVSLQALIDPILKRIPEIAGMSETLKRIPEIAGMSETLKRMRDFPENQNLRLMKSFAESPVARELTAFKSHVPLLSPEQIEASVQAQAEAEKARRRIDRSHDQVGELRKLRREVRLLREQGERRSDAPSAQSIATETTVENTVPADTKSWIATEASNMKKDNKIPAGINITDFAKLLQTRMKAAAGHNSSIHAIGWVSIRNRLRGWGLFPISDIKI
jgi:hypothetical protein